MDLPSHPESKDTASDRRPATGSSWGPRIVVAAVVVLLAAIVILHLTGIVGPGAQ
jgi:hypothetical protein